MCGNPFKAPKIPETPARAPTASELDPQLAPKLNPEVSGERGNLKSSRTGRSALRIDLDGAVPGGTGLRIPRA